MREMSIQTSMATAAMPRRQDTTKGPPLRVLSLDGGGVRGYSCMLILQELMHRTFVEIHGRAPKRHEIPKPCDHFDLIAGTGTGGLIAIMLGRLRMDLETCKDVYVKMTKRVFETDKTIAGIPYRSTLFKASKLEEAIRECVREHTVFDDEGNDHLANAQDIYSPSTPSSSRGGPTRSISSASGRSRASASYETNFRSSLGAGRWGNPNALLYDTRENRTKTAVTAVLKGTKKGEPATLIRSYDSRKEPAPEYNTTIWQTGRATCAIGLAFKPMHIGHSVFIDEGNGRFNPSPQILDEAAVNEWPGREVGVFVSIGTGKRPAGTDSNREHWFESFLGGSLGEFAEAKRRLVFKIEGCEETHQYMVRDHLPKRGVPIDNYYRLNVEVGVADFGMNEWNRLSDISINTRHYLNKPEVQALNYSASSKMARIHKAKVRWERSQLSGNVAAYRNSWEIPDDGAPDPSSSSSFAGVPPPSDPLAVELPADEGYSGSRPTSFAPTDDKFAVIASDEFPTVVLPGQHPPTSPSHDQIYRYPSVGNPPAARPPPPPPPPPAAGGPGGAATGPNNGGRTTPTTPPPRPPKTPIPFNRGSPQWGAQPPPPPPPPPPQQPPPQQQQQQAPPPLRPSGLLPYPDDDAPPPAVNMARKPEFR